MKTHKLIIRKDIKEMPTEEEKKCIRQWGQNINNKCIDCGKPIYYFNQCADCNGKMILQAKIMY